jgi:thiol-disulfide isomerase/thioredoxin
MDIRARAKITSRFRTPMLMLGTMVFGLGLSPSPSPRAVDGSDITDLVVRYRGKIVLLNFWATWCPPCAHEFPELVKVEKQYRGRGVVIISVSVDFPDEIGTKLLPFLEKHQPGFEVYIKEDGDLNQFTRAIDPGWKGTIPATFFYTRQGESSVKRYSEMTRQEMVRILEALLEDPIP